MSASNPSIQGFTCVLCGHTQGDLVVAQCQDFYMGKPGRFDYAACHACQLLQLTPIPPDVGIYYENYQVHSKKSLLHEVSRMVLMSGGYFKGQVSNQRLLDFGSGDGWFLRRMLQAGASAEGFEFNASHAASLQAQLGCDIFSDRALLAEKRRSYYDIVTMHFVLEHLTDPLQAISIISQILKPGGRLYLIIPNIESPEFRIFGRYWHGFDPPRHIQFLTPAHLDRLARETGLQISAIGYKSLPNDFAGTMTAILLRRFSYALFAAMALPGLLWSTFSRRGNLIATLVKK